MTSPLPNDVLSTVPNLDETKPYVIRHYIGQVDGKKLYVRGTMDLELLRGRTAAEFYIIHGFDGKIYAGATGAEAVERYINLQHGDKFSEQCYQQYFMDTTYPPTHETIYAAASYAFF